MGILFGSKETRSWIPEPPVPAYLGATIGGLAQSVRTRPDLALQASAVYACANLMANTVAQMPLSAFRMVDNLPQQLPTQPQILVNPSGTMTQSQWLHQAMYSLVLRGNLYGRLSKFNGFMFPTQCDLLHPDVVTVDVDDKTGAVTYKAGPKRELVPEHEMFHVLGMTPPGGAVGISTIAAAALTVDLSLAAQKFGADYLQNGGIPKAVITTDQEIDAPQARSIKDKVVASTRNREPLVIGDGLTYTQIQIKPEESQFLAAIAATDTQIARFFGVPPAMIGAPEGSSMTYSNREQRALDFLTFGVGFWLKRLEDALTTLLPSQQFVKFDVSTLLRTDVETDVKVDVQYVAGHIKAPSEIRTKLGLPPMTEEQKVESDLVALEITPAGTPKAIPGIIQVPNDPNLPVGETVPKQPAPKA